MPGGQDDMETAHGLHDRLLLLQPAQLGAHSGKFALECSCCFGGGEVADPIRRQIPDAVPCAHAVTILRKNNALVHVTGEVTRGNATILCQGQLIRSFCRELSARGGHSLRSWV